MIASIDLSNVATYAERQRMDGLKDVNFIFGTNGAGKTTIGRVIASLPDFPTCSMEWRDGIVMQSLVYNRDFVDANFNASANLKGIFTLGEKDIANEMAIAAKKDEVDRYDKEIAQYARTLGDAREDTGKLGELAKVEAECKDRCWEQKRRHDGKFSQAFTGARNDAARFKERLLDQLQSNVATPCTLDDLTERAATIFGPAPQSQALIPSLPSARIVELEEAPILAKKVVGKDDVDIAEMIHRLGHSDWVKSGQALYEASAPHCPFCQQTAPAGLKASLEQYFDDTFARDLQAIADLQTAYDKENKSLLLALQAVEDQPSSFLDSTAFARLRDIIEAKLLANALILANKRKEPSAPQALDSLADSLRAANEMIAGANAKIAEHNRIVDSLSEERTKLGAQVWRYIIDDMKAYLDVYAATKKALTAAIANLQRQTLAAREGREKAERDLRQLEKSATTVQPTVDAINDLLKSFGFKTFSLDRVGDEPHYKLVRENGTDAKNSLSEGEKSFVTFLYFYHLIKGSDSESGGARDRVVVFDDPVSSMDSEVLFIVSSLIRGLIEDMKAGRGHVKQVFVLTHNVYFHKEVCFQGTRRAGKGGKGGKEAERHLQRSFWVVRKSPAGARLERYEENPIKTSYDLLWDELRKEEKNRLTIQNTMRRILEHYFKILGGLDFDSLCDKFEGRDKVVCRSLLSWVNDGSHYSHDDAYFALGDDVIPAQLDIFKKIFEKTEHMPHYDMMMAKG